MELRAAVCKICCQTPSLHTEFFLTNPVSVASGERSFSKLKIIKNYLRNSMSQERLNGLAIISIEHEVASSIQYDEVIDEFAAAKARKGSF